MAGGHEPAVLRYPDPDSPGLLAQVRVGGLHAVRPGDVGNRRSMRPRGTGEGVPPETIVASTTRPVPLRDFAPDGEILLHPGFGEDRFAEYLVLATDGDGPADWLQAGEATSAAWLTANPGWA